MERDTEQKSQNVAAALIRVNGDRAKADSRPDWDPYAVWLTHIMKSPQTADEGQQAVGQKNAGDSPPASGDGSWNPYAVWQSLIKS